MSIDKHRATGTLEVPSAGTDIVLSCQVALVDGSGKTVHLKPVRCFLGAARGTDGQKPSDELTFWGEVIDPDGDCELKLHDGEVACDVPGKLHDLNIDRVDGPRIMHEIEGDFVATVKVVGSFQRGPVRTGPKSVPCNCGGLLVWLDDGNYIRLERAAMHCNDCVLGLVVFESREEGTRAEGHNKGGDRSAPGPLAAAGAPRQRNLGIPERRWEGLGGAPAHGCRLAVSAQGWC